MVKRYSLARDRVWCQDHLCLNHSKIRLAQYRLTAPIIVIFWIIMVFMRHQTNIPKGERVQDPFWGKFMEVIISLLILLMFVIALLTVMMVWQRQTDTGMDRYNIKFGLFYVYTILLSGSGHPSSQWRTNSTWQRTPFWQLLQPSRTSGWLSSNSSQLT